MQVFIQLTVHFASPNCFCQSTIFRSCIVQLRGLQGASFSFVLQS